jgi:hypothetical protein
MPQSSAAAAERQKKKKKQKKQRLIAVTITNSCSRDHRMLYRLFLFFMLCSSSMILTVFTTTLVTSAAALINCTDTSFFAFNRLLLWNRTQEMMTTTTKKGKSSGNDDDAQEQEAFEDSYHLNESSLEYSDVDRMAPAQEDQIEQLLDGSNDDDAAAIQRQEQERYSGRAEQQASTAAAATFLLRHHQQLQADIYRSRFFRSRVSGNGPRQSNVFMRRRIDPWKLELYYNFKYAPLWSQMLSLLRNWVDNRGFQPQIMQRLMDDVKVPIDSSNNNNNRKQAVEDNVENDMTENDVENSSSSYSSSSSSTSSSSTTTTTMQKQQQRRLYNSCAVVGNSGILLNSTYGAFIDSHEMVMRINNAKIKGFKRFVGAKTSIAFMNSHILRVCAHYPQCWCHPYGVEVSLFSSLLFSSHLLCSLVFPQPAAP